MNGSRYSPIIVSWYLLHCVIIIFFFQINLHSFNNCLSSNLPSYARPLFLRLSEEIPVTGTFKMQKVALAKQGFNPEECSKVDNLYYFDSTKKEYIPLDENCYKNILDHQIRF